MIHNYRGKAWEFGDNVNTDLMYPHICYTLPEEQRPAYTMWANRPDWAKQIQSGDILVAGKNFGTGSSRPAAANLKGLGLSCAVAEEINGLFLRNCMNFAFPVMSSPGITRLAKEGDVLEVDFDAGRIKNITTTREISCKPLPQFLMRIIDSGGIIEMLKQKGLLETSPY